MRIVAAVTCAVAGFCTLFGARHLGLARWRGGPESCSTFVLSSGGTLVVGHNLDEGFDVLGEVVVNKRGVKKENVSWEDLRIGGASGVPRLAWVSRYGSVTYNTIGREFVDGGLNEAGLYVGEMTLLGSRYPSGAGVPKLYHHQWMQYLLDTRASVREVLDSLRVALPDGHCQWHFLVADQGGDVAVIEFLDGRAVVRAGKDLPVKVLGNLPYAEELKAAAGYEGFGGRKGPAFGDRENGRRFVWGARMLAAYGERPPKEAVPYAFSILKQLDKGATRWSLVYDVPARRLSWRTDKAPAIRSVSFSSFDLSCSGPPLVLDVHEAFAGEAARRFRAPSDEENRQAVRAALKQWDMGFLGNSFLKPRMVSRISAAAARFRCGS